MDLSAKYEEIPSRLCIMFPNMGWTTQKHNSATIEGYNQFKNNVDSLLETNSHVKVRFLSIHLNFLPKEVVAANKKSIINKIH